ncbi:MAG: AAA family ATPase [Paraclostridium sordellii]
MQNILIKGSPGTGKTLISRAMAYYLCEKRINIDDIYSQDIESDYEDIEKFNQSDRVEFIQVHTSMSYEDIVYGIEIKTSNSLNIEYTEKRIKKLCDKAKKSEELYCIILDDIGRNNAGALLGNLLYAMEYRNQPIDLVDGNTMTIPDNVYIIITKCEQINGNSLEYALRRRMDYIKELHSSRDIIDSYYESVLTDEFKKIILDIYDEISSFIRGNVIEDPSINIENYIPGHGMFLVSKNGTENDILQSIKFKLMYQVFPYIKEIKENGLILGDLDTFFEDIENRINIGESTDSNISSVEKIFYKDGTEIKYPNYSLEDSREYYNGTILKEKCKPYREIIENIIDAMFLNELLPKEVVLSDVLKNTSVVRFPNRTSIGEDAAFIVEESNNMDYFYKKAGENERSFFSNRAPRSSRWSNCDALKKHTPMYKFNMNDGRSKYYISLNAVRNEGFTINRNKIYSGENPAYIYPATYKLVEAYIKTCINNLMILSSTDSDYKAMYKLAIVEKEYLRKVHISAKNYGNKENKLINLCEKISSLKILWSSKGSIINVDEKKFTNILSNIHNLTVETYEDLFNITTGSIISINIKGVNKMTNLRDYQKIMNDIGVRQMIFQGPPGTSKTFESKRFILQQLNAASPVLAKELPTQEEISNALEEYKLTDEDYRNPSDSPKKNTGGWDLVQFHPSYGYEDFIRGIEVKAVEGVPTYSSVNRILGKIAQFAKIAEQATADGEEVPNFYLIIDEINRANLATVFGELIYGLEYRNSKVSTPYEVDDLTSATPDAKSKDIVLGKNLFIIGTMNTADKSIDAIDYAIRRRFIFIDSPANRDVILKCYKNTMGLDDENSIELLVFDAVNELFEDEDFYNSDYQKSDVKLGHTYFLRTNQEHYLDIFIKKFIFQVIPILREYVKDGIFESDESFISNENTVDTIKATREREEQVKLIRDNIKLFICNFNDKNADGNIIDNEYIESFILNLSNQLGY